MRDRTVEDLCQLQLQFVGMAIGGSADESQDGDEEHVVEDVGAIELLFDEGVYLEDECLEVVGAVGRD